MRTDRLGANAPPIRPASGADRARPQRADVDTRRRSRRDEDTVDFTFVDGAYEPRAPVEADVSADSGEGQEQAAAGLASPLAASFNGPQLYTRNAKMNSIAPTGPTRRIDVYA